jgi:hypothetical protein
MTPAESQRAYRARQRAQKAPSPSPPPDEPAARAQPERAIVPAQTAGHADEKLRQALVEAVHERDIARNERNQIRRQFEEVCEQRAAMRGALPQAEVISDPTRICWCSFCGKRAGDHPGLGLKKPEVKTMIAVGLTFICNECIEKFSAWINS